jgi:hypothetical protein
MNAPSCAPFRVFGALLPRVAGKAGCGESPGGWNCNPRLDRIDGREVPLHAYVFEAVATATL